jgi:hypothetical protein
MLFLLIKTISYRYNSITACGFINREDGENGGESLVPCSLHADLTCGGWGYLFVCGVWWKEKEWT